MTIASKRSLIRECPEPIRSLTLSGRRGSHLHGASLVSHGQQRLPIGLAQVCLVPLRAIVDHDGDGQGLGRAFGGDRMGPDLQLPGAPDEQAELIARRAARFGSSMTPPSS